MEIQVQMQIVNTLKENSKGSQTFKVSTRPACGIQLLIGKAQGQHSRNQ